MFYGDVAGSGDFTGSGEVIFEGAYSPGSSPAAVSLEGDVTFGSGAALIMELGGLVPGDQHDQLSIGGELTPGGTLQISLIDDLTPQAGDTFGILDFDSISGAEFEQIELPELTGRKVWDTSNLYSTGSVSVIAMLEGDTDVDWDVDLLDYNAFIGALGAQGDWRTDFNEDGRIDLADFVMLRRNFGAYSGLASGAALDAATTPEPTAMMALAVAIPLLLKGKRR